MAVQLILKNSSVEDRHPTANQLTNGEISLNYNEAGAFLSCLDTNGDIQHIGGVKIDDATPSSPSKQALWFQPSTGKLFIYDGTGWLVVAESTDLGLGVVDAVSVEVTSSTGSNVQLPAATGTTAGVLTAAEKTSIGTATQPGDNVSGLTNDAGYITLAEVPGDLVTSVAGKTGDVTLVKADITDFSDSDYATAAQGLTADSATQPLDNVSTLTNDAGYITATGTYWTEGANQLYPADAGNDVLIGGTLPASPNIELNAADGSATFAGKLVSASTVSGDTGTTLATKDYVDSSGGGAVDSVNTQTGAVVLDADDISDSATTNKFVTQTELNSIASATQPGDNISTLTNNAGYITATGTYWDRTGTTLSPANAGDKATSASTVSGDGGTTLATKDYVDSAYPGIPQNAQTSAYTLVSTDNGKHISITTGGVTVPSGVFSVGDTISIYNNSAADQTITQGASVTLRFAGTVNTGNRTLAQRGLVTVLCVGNNEFVISGGGLS